MEVLTRVLKVVCLWELLYTDNMVLMAETLEDLKKKLIFGMIILRQKGSVSVSVKQNLYVSNPVFQSSQLRAQQILHTVTSMHATCMERFLHAQN